MSVTINDVSNLARAMVDATEAVADADEKLKIAKENLRIIREDTIPGVMQELGVTALTLDDGKKMSLKQEVYTQLANDDKPVMYDWLEAHGFGGLIKTEVTVTFGKSELSKAQSLVRALKARELDVGLEHSVHSQTLKAFLKEQLAKGADIPLDVFGARPVSVATIKNK